MILVGGLGGGGDSGGALSVAIALRKLDIEVSILGMVSCRVDDIQRVEHLCGALVRVNEDSWSGGRFFEPHIAALGWETYVMCLNESLDKAVEGLDYLKEQGVKAVFSVDFGGDALVRGDEPEVGSAASDAMGLAILAKAREIGLESLLGIGALGAEGGGCIPIELLVENLLLVAENHGYFGSYVPERDVEKEFLRSVSFLLERVPSFMLTVYVDALRERLGERFYRVAYFKGKFNILRHYRYVYVLDPLVVCQINYFCQVALKRKYRGAVRSAMKARKVGKRTGIANWEKTLHRLAAKRWDYRSWVRRCLH